MSRKPIILILRHPREGGGPAACPALGEEKLDPRLRGDDGRGWAG